MCGQRTAGDYWMDDLFFSQLFGLAFSSYYKFVFEIDNHILIILEAIKITKIGLKEIVKFINVTIIVRF